MAKYSDDLPNLNTKDIFLSNYGVLMSAWFNHGLTPGPKNTTIHFMDDPKAVKFLEDTYSMVADFVLNTCKVGYIFEPISSWKASLEIAQNDLGYSMEKWQELLRKVVDLGVKIRTKFEQEAIAKAKDCKPILITMCIGPKEGGYKLGTRMTVEQAKEYHLPQVEFFSKQPEVDYLSAMTFSDPIELIGLVMAAKECRMKIAVSMTVEKHDGKLISGYSIEEAIKLIDKETESWPIFYCINCSHPSFFRNFYFEGADQDWAKRIRYLKCNASSKSHDELDNSDTLDAGDPLEFGRQVAEIVKRSDGNINMVYGCCGTNMEHIKETARSIGVWKES